MTEIDPSILNRLKDDLQDPHNLTAFIKDLHQLEDTARKHPDPELESLNAAATQALIDSGALPKGLVVQDAESHNVQLGSLQVKDVGEDGTILLKSAGDSSTGSPPANYFLDATDVLRTASNLTLYDPTQKQSDNTPAGKLKLVSAAATPDAPGNEAPVPAPPKPNDIPRGTPPQGDGQVTAQAQTTGLPRDASGRITQAGLFQFKYADASSTQPSEIIYTLNGQSLVQKKGNNWIDTQDNVRLAGPPTLDQKTGVVTEITATGHTVRLEPNQPEAAQEERRNKPAGTPASLEQANHSTKGGWLVARDAVKGKPQEDEIKARGARKVQYGDSLSDIAKAHLKVVHADDPHYSPKWKDIDDEMTRIEALPKNKANGLDRTKTIHEGMTVYLEDQTQTKQ